MGASTFLFLNLYPSESFANETGPIVTVGTPLVKMAGKKTQAVIMGTGFKPGQEIKILITTKDGMQSNLGAGLKPHPVPDKSGSWVTTWNCGRFVSRKLVTAGVYNLTVTDNKYNHIAHTPIGFIKAKAKKKKK
jgi:hypothetical protein